MIKQHRLVNEILKDEIKNGMDYNYVQKSIEFINDTCK